MAYRTSHGDFNWYDVLVLEDIYSPLQDQFYEEARHCESRFIFDNLPSV